jgi:hypothetical protein
LAGGGTGADRAMGKKGWPQVRNLSVLMTRAAMGSLYGKCFGRGVMCKRTFFALESRY